MKKIEAVFVTAQVELTANRTMIGSCLRATTLTPAQCETVLTRLRQVMGNIASQVKVSYYRQATIIWVEAGIALCRRSLHREMRRFARVLEGIGLAETAEVCSPFKVSYQ